MAVTGWSVLFTVLLALIGALACMLVVTVVGRLVRRARDRRRERIRRAIRPAVIEVLAEPDADVALHVPRGRAASDLFRVLAYDYLAKVKGESHDALVRVLVERGAVSAAEHRARRPGVVGRLSAIELLGRCGLARSRPALEPLLRHRALDVRAASARALGHVGDPDAIPALFAATRGARAVPAAIAAQAVLRIGPDGAPRLREALDDPEPAVRAIAATVLGLQRSVPAVPALCDIVAHDPDPAVRRRAIHSLSLIGDPRAVEGLTRAATEPLLSAVAAEALGRLGAHEAIPTLVALLGDHHHDVALAAADALVECGRPGVAALVDLDHRAGPGAAYATAVLARLGLGRDEAPCVTPTTR